MDLAALTLEACKGYYKTNHCPSQEQRTEDVFFIQNLTTSVFVSTVSYWNLAYKLASSIVNHVRPQTTHSPELDAPLRHGQGGYKEDHGRCF